MNGIADLYDPFWILTQFPRERLTSRALTISGQLARLHLPYWTKVQFTFQTPTAIFDANRLGPCPTVHVVGGSEAFPQNQSSNEQQFNGLESLDRTRGSLGSVIASLFVLLAVFPVNAQQINGEPGSPSGTTTINGAYLPAQPPPFGGVINLNASQSKPYWPPTVVPPKGAPNVLLIMTDDAGYGISSTFGGVIPTPALERVAQMGLRYTQFHSTALCSPTRAALITGRNHHSVGFGVVTEQSTGYPGYDSIIGPENATVGEILKDNGYATSWFGKEHNTPSFQYTVAGPFDQWPVGMGFEYFYGFMGGETDQWTPYLFRNQTQIYPWVGKPGYNLTTDLADEAIKYMQELNAAAPDKPFFLYYVPGGTHAPHQPTPEWIEKFKGKFDMGWNTCASRSTLIRNGSA